MSAGLARILANKFARQLGALALAQSNFVATKLQLSQFANGGVLGPLTTIAVPFTFTPLQTGTFVELNVAANGTTVGGASALVSMQIAKGSTVLRTGSVNAGAANGEEFFVPLFVEDVAPATGGHTYTITLTSLSAMTIPIGGLWIIAKELSPIYTL